MIPILFSIFFYFSFIFADTATNKNVDSLESKAQFGGKTLHKIEFDGPRGYEIHYFVLIDSKNLAYVCNKKCLIPKDELFEKSIDSPMNAMKIKMKREYSVFEKLKHECAHLTERPSIKNCMIVNAPQIQGYNEMTRSIQ